MTYNPISLPLPPAGPLSASDTLVFTQGASKKVVTLGALRTFLNLAATATPAVESAEGTSITTVGPVLVDAAGNTYAINNAGQVATNGAGDPITANVVRLYYHNHQMYQKNLANEWYTRANPQSAYAYVADPTAAAVAPAAAVLPAFSHIVVCIMENHALSQIIGNADAPFINNTLKAGGMLLTDYHGITHPSQPNYYALYGGDTFGLLDNNVHSVPDPSLSTALAAAGKTFRGFIETASPSKHNPWESFPEGKTVERDFATWPADFTTLPPVAYVVPDLLHDMHDGTIAQGDAWLAANMAGYCTWARNNNSLFILTFDEDSNGGDAPLATILYGSRVAVGTNGTRLDHYGLLRSVCTVMGATPPRNAATAATFPASLFTAAATMLAESAEGASVTTVGPVLVDAARNTYAINAAGQVATNGVGEAATANVVRLYYHNHALYQKNATNEWYTRASLQSAWVYVADPTAAPAPTPPVAAAESADGTAVTTVGPTIVDASGNVCSLSADGYVVTNGVKETTTSYNVVKLYYKGHQFYQKNGSNEWYTRTSATAAYSGPVADPSAPASTTAPPATTPATTSAYFQASPSDRFLTPSGGAFYAKGINVQMDGSQPTLAQLRAMYPGMNFVRMVTGPGYGDQNRMNQMILDGQAAKVVCMLDYHATASATPVSALGPVKAWYADFATRHKNNPYLWFNTTNEPDGNYDTIAAEQGAIYGAVRGTGNNSVILCSLRGGGYTEWLAGRGATWAGMRNVGWSIHFYGYLTLNYGGSGREGDIATTPAALAALIAKAQSYRSADGIMPCIIDEFGPSTSGGANTKDANGDAVVNAVLNGTHGWVAWAHNGTGTPGGDALTNDGVNLTDWGRKVVARLAQSP